MFVFDSAFTSLLSSNCDTCHSDQSKKNSLVLCSSTMNTLTQMLYLHDSLLSRKLIHTFIDKISYITNLSENKLSEVFKVTFAISLFFAIESGKEPRTNERITN